MQQTLPCLLLHFGLYPSPRVREGQGDDAFMPLMKWVLVIKAYPVMNVFIFQMSQNSFFASKI